MKLVLKGLNIRLDEEGSSFHKYSSSAELLALWAFFGRMYFGGVDGWAGCLTLWCGLHPRWGFVAGCMGYRLECPLALLLLLGVQCRSAPRVFRNWGGRKCAGTFLPLLKRELIARVIHSGTERLLTVRAKSLWLYLAIPLSTDLINWQTLVPWRWLIALLHYLSILSFVKTVKGFPCSFNEMTWLLSL